MSKRNPRPQSPPKDLRETLYGYAPRPGTRRTAPSAR